MPEPQSPFKRVRRHFNQKSLKKVCEMHETDFGEAYEMDTVIIKERHDDNFYFFKDNGSNILAVAHLDTVMPHKARKANFVSTQAGPVVYSGALDDRLGAYTILELLPKLGLNFDILLSVGEESGRSTAQFFEPPEGKEYNWMIEFDRGGTDVVMYQYDDAELRGLVRDSGARPADGIFSDISYMEHLEIKGCNWGVGYRDYHGARSHAYLEDYWMMIAYFLKFHDVNKDVYLPHEMKSKTWGRSYSSGSLWGGDYYDEWGSSPYQSSYKTPRGESWWDAGEDNDRIPWYKDETCWEEAHWDAYLNGGEDAVREVGPPEGYEDPEEEEVEDVVTILGVDGDDPFPDVPGELVSDDFVAVNRALTAGSSVPDSD